MNGACLYWTIHAPELPVIVDYWYDIAVNQVKIVFVLAKTSKLVE